MKMQSLMKKRNKQRLTERLIKESLLCQLSHTVKEVQLLHSQTGESFVSNEACNSLVVVLESIFLHGIKRGLLSSAIKSVSGEESKPQPSFWNVVCQYTHRNIVTSIKSLSQITTDVGRCRVWIRMALNETELTSYFQAIEKDRRHVNSQYNNFAFLRDHETCDTASKLLDGLVNVFFEIPLNSCILNQWSNEPLMLSGIWSPPMKTPISNAVDVAEGINDDLDDDDNDDTYSIRTSSSMTTLSTILALDENQALKMILEAPIKKSEKETSSSPIAIQPTSSKSDNVKNVITEEAEEDDNKVNHDSPQENSHLDNNNETTNDERNASLPQIGNSLLNISGWSSAFEQENANISELRTQEGPFKGNDTTNSTNYYKNLLQEGEPIVENQQDQSPDEDEPSDYEILTLSKFYDEESSIFKIARETGLHEQKYTCASCQLSIGLNFAEARLCNLTGKYYCETCHTNEVNIIPSRLIFNWDHKRYSVCCKANKYLNEIFNKPFLDIKNINPKLYSVVKEMGELRKIRLQLNMLRAYLYTCRIPIINELQKKVWPREYIYEHIHQYSISDLCKVPGGTLAAELNLIVSFARDHVLNCWLCSQKGFICEVCKNPRVIYPFDCASTYRCSQCQAVYHEGCLLSSKNCLKCKRRKERATSSSESNDLNDCD